MNKYKHLTWIFVGSLVAFLASYIFGNLPNLPVDIYYLIYFLIISSFFIAYIKTTNFDTKNWFSKKIFFGIILGLIFALIMAKKVLSLPATEQFSGGMLVWALVWRGIMYGLVDGLLLTAFPWIVTWRAFEVNQKSFGKKVFYSLVAWIFVLFITTAYHAGYTDFRSKKLIQPNIGNTLISIPTFISLNPLASPITHMGMHVAAVVHSPQTDLYLPPHRNNNVILTSSKTEVVDSPNQTVESFYNWYLRQTDNPLNSGAYKTSNYLSESYKVKVDGILASFDKGGYDPILLAQDKPENIKIKSQIIEGEQARVIVDEYFSNGTQTLMVALQKTDNIWQITDIIKDESHTLAPTKSEYKTAIVYFSNPKKSMGSTECGLVFGVERTILKDAGYELVLKELFSGPSEDEKAQGFTSLFSEKTAGILKSVNVANDVAYVNLKDIRNIIPNASSSCGSKEFISQVEETLKHDRKINKVFFAIEGDPQKFYDWVQIGCNRDNNNCNLLLFK